MVEFNQWHIEDLTLDVDSNTQGSIPVIYGRQGDKDGILCNIELTQQGVPLQASWFNGKRVFYEARGNGVSVRKQADAIEGNVVKVVLPEAVFNQIGLVPENFLRVEDATTGELIISGTTAFRVYVRQGNLDPDASRYYLEEIENISNEFKKWFRQVSGTIGNDAAAELAAKVVELENEKVEVTTYLQSELKTKQQLAQTEQDLTAQLQQKADQSKVITIEARIGDIIQSSDLDPNKDQEIVDARHGETTLSAKIGLMTDKLNTPTPSDMRTHLGEMGLLSTYKPIIINRLAKQIEFSEGFTYVWYRNKSYTVNTAAFNLPYTNGVFYFKTSNNSFGFGSIANMTEDDVILGYIYDHTAYIAGQESFTQTHTGAFLICSQKINIDRINNQIVLPEGFKYVFYGNKLLNIGNPEIIIPKATNAATLQGIVILDIDTKVFSVISSNNDIRTNKHIVIGVIYPNNIILHADYLINGKAPIKNNSVTKEMLDFTPITEIPTLTIESKWKNKTFITFGDSITWYDGNPFGSGHKESGVIAKGYQYYMREQLQCTVIKNGVSNSHAPQIVNNQVLTADYTGVDAVTFTSGANDARVGIPVGDLKEIGGVFDGNTYIGAIQKGIEHILTTNNKIKIYLLCPIRGWYNEYNTTAVPNPNPDIVGMMPEDYSLALKKIGKLYGIPVLDWYNLTFLNDKNKNTYLGDILSLPYYLHPTNEFYEIMASSLIPFLNNH